MSHYHNLGEYYEVRSKRYHIAYQWLRRNAKHPTRKPNRRCLLWHIDDIRACLERYPHTKLPPLKQKDAYALNKVFCEGTGAKTPHEAITKGARTMQEWCDMLEQRRVA